MREPVVEVAGQLRPHMRIVARDQLIALLFGQPLELADRFDGFLGRHADVAADRQLVLDVLGEIGGVEREHEPVTTHRLVEFDDETLVPRRVPVGRDRRDARGDLGFAVGQPPLDARVVEVDADDRVVLGLGVIGQPVLEFAALRVHRHLACEQFQAAGMVVVQVAHRDGVDVVDVDADVVQRLFDRLTGSRQHRDVLDGRVEPPVQRGIPDQRGVEPGVQQHPAAVGLQQHAGHRFAHPLFGRSAVDRNGLRQLLPAECQQDDPADLANRGHQPTDSAAIRSEFGFDTACACSTPFSHGWATTKSSMSATFSQHPVSSAAAPASEIRLRRTVRQALRQRGASPAATSSPGS